MCIVSMNEKEISIEYKFTFNKYKDIIKLIESLGAD